jgi:hypothetical protein
MQIASRDPEMAAYLQDKLNGGDPWQDVAASAAYHCQRRSSG